MEERNTQLSQGIGTDMWSKARTANRLQWLQMMRELTYNRKALIRPLLRPME
jgi:hypothetical protein